ncbi:response regulator [Xylophilus rhododendri]|uniref:Response regulator n=1 Tax=Xylophilus rhododendri TaxID=2697032 RepID=A0A857J2A1_9BURK|nr:two-component system response regulator [Xylophilus rhododendri]QHI97856.1 response regulator [Xylophilus rhododendri]
MSPNTRSGGQATLLLVDDEPVNLQVLRHTLQDQYRLLFARDGVRALELAASEQPDMVLLDVMMPGMTGHEVCRAMRATPGIAHIPVIFVTALADNRSEAAGFEAGGVDYITKPISPPIVRARVRTHLSLVRVEELLHTRLQIVQRLGLAAEYKDNETGMHVLRMSHYSQILALAAGYSEREAEDLLHAAPMHDIGKIGIPDAILRKNGKLDPHEWDVMRSHVEIGARIIGEHQHGVLHTAQQVTLTHHEKWDGSGYPNGLKGEEIPLAGRIVAIADVFDALTSERPYKNAWPVEKALDLLREQAGQHFDPTLVELFLANLPAILAVRERFPEEKAAPLPAEAMAG